MYFSVDPGMRPPGFRDLLNYRGALKQTEHERSRRIYSMGHMTPNESISGAPNYGIGCTKEFGMPPGGTEGRLR